MEKDDIWDITDRPHTKLKLEILKKYLKAWAIIIGEHFNGWNHFKITH